MRSQSLIIIIIFALIYSVKQYVHDVTRLLCFKINWCIDYTTAYYVAFIKSSQNFRGGGHHKTSPSSQIVVCLRCFEYILKPRTSFDRMTKWSKRRYFIVRHNVLIACLTRWAS